MREYRIDLNHADAFAGVVEAFNAGFCRHHGGTWHGRSWDAFEDYLHSGFDEDGRGRYRLVFDGWSGCTGLGARDREMIARILARIPQIEAVFG